MSKMPLEFEGDTEKTYDALISIIENNQGRLAPIIVGCDELRLRERVIERYEREAKEVKIRPYRIRLDSEPSVRAGLDKLVLQEEYLQAGREAVFTVLGADTLLRVKLRDDDEQSELEKFFGYLQWTREGLRSFRFPIVLWVSVRMLREMGRRAPDFWSWRKASFQFGMEDERLAEISRKPIEVSNSFQDEDELLPPLDELLQELQELQKRDPDSPNSPTLYSKIAKNYAKRVRSGEAKDLEFERSAAIEYFEKAIEGMRTIGENIRYVDNLIDLGDFLTSQSSFTKATKIFHIALEVSQANKLIPSMADVLSGLGTMYYYLCDYKKTINFEEQSLEIHRVLDRKNKMAMCLHNLGNAYYSLEKYRKAIEYYLQSIEIENVLSNQKCEAETLTNLGNCYSGIGEYGKAIALLEKALPIHRKFKNCEFEASSLISLGHIYSAIGNPQKAFDYSKEALDISQTIGDRQHEALVLYCMAHALAKLDRGFEALQIYQKAQIIFEEIPIEYQVQQCKDAIRQLNRIFTVTP